MGNNLEAIIVSNMDLGMVVKDFDYEQQQLVLSTNPLEGLSFSCRRDAVDFICDYLDASWSPYNLKVNMVLEEI